MTKLQQITKIPERFHSNSEIFPQIKAACEAHDDAEFHELGLSEEGRPIYACALGHGGKTVSLLAGAHSDEPVGPATLRALILQTLARPRDFAELFEQFKFVVIPHVNPDGEAKNKTWIQAWPEPEAYISHVFRELPGRDVEFGYPAMRKENQLVAGFLKKHAPFHLHFSMHGMGFSDGLFLLIEKSWIDRTIKLREKFSKMAMDLQCILHDHDRNGEKGFQYIGPGFTTTPEGGAMRDYFVGVNDEHTASLFHDSSMEFVRKLGGDPLCLVTELPLFLVNKKFTPQPGKPVGYLELKKQLPGWKQKLACGESIAEALAELQITAFPLQTQIQCQLRIINWALERLLFED